MRKREINDETRGGGALTGLEEDDLATGAGADARTLAMGEGHV